MYVKQTKSETLVTADYQGSGWEDDNPSVFIMTIVGSLGGEYQITNGYGPDKAPQVLKVRTYAHFNCTCDTGTCILTHVNIRY